MDHAVLWQAGADHAVTDVAAPVPPAPRPTDHEALDPAAARQDHAALDRAAVTAHLLEVPYDRADRDRADRDRGAARRRPG